MKMEGRGNKRIERGGKPMRVCSYACVSVIISISFFCVRYSVRIVLKHLC